MLFVDSRTIRPGNRQGIATAALPADPVVIVTEYGAFDPRRLSITEHAVGIAHLAVPEHKEKL